MKLLTHSKAFLPKIAAGYTKTGRLLFQLRTDRCRHADLERTCRRYGPPLAVVFFAVEAAVPERIKDFTGLDVHFWNIGDQDAPQAKMRASETLKQAKPKSRPASRQSAHIREGVVLTTILQWLHDAG
jgi:hypothetical protein